MNTDEPKPRVVVRIRTSYYRTGKGAAVKKEIITLRRPSQGFDFFDQEISMIGADEALGMIQNLHKVEDGVYELVICNESRDWESGHIDSYDFTLIPFKA